MTDLTTEMIELIVDKYEGVEEVPTSSLVRYIRQEVPGMSDLDLSDVLGSLSEIVTYINFAGQDKWNFALM